MYIVNFRVTAKNFYKEININKYSLGDIKQDKIVIKQDKIVIKQSSKRRKKKRKER